MPTLDKIFFWVHDEYMLHKIFKKAGPDLHIFLNSVVLLGALIALTLFTYVVWKHLLLKSAVKLFVFQAEIATKQKFVGADAAEDAQMAAIAVGTIPSAKPLFTDKVELQKYIDALSKATNRDIVVIDKNEMILADTVSANVGKVYTYSADADRATMKDGLSRRFTEISKDYPSGIDEVVVPIKDVSGVVEGALLMSTSTIFNTD